MSKYHNQARVSHHVVVDMRVVTEKDNDSLSSRDPLADVALILSPVNLPCFKAAQSCWPASFMTFLHERV